MNALVTGQVNDNFSSKKGEKNSEKTHVINKLET